jgi:hypothetical protein
VRPQYHLILYGKRGFVELYSGPSIKGFQMYQIEELNTGKVSSRFP